MQNVPLLLYTKDSFTTNVRPLTVVYCCAFPLLSRTLPLVSAWAAVMRMTWLARNSSDVASSEYRVLLSRSFELMRTSVVGTRRIYIQCPSASAMAILGGGVMAYVIIDRVALSGKCASKESP